MVLEEIKETFENVMLWLLGGDDITRNKCVNSSIPSKREEKECHQDDNSVLM